MAAASAATGARGKRARCRGIAAEAAPTRTIGARDSLRCGRRPLDLLRQAHGVLRPVPMAGSRWRDDAEGMRHDAGSSLIESLAALAVFAIGSACHGTWTMQSMAIHARASRLLAATTAVASLEVRMRANKEGVVAGHYDDDESMLSCSEACDTRERAGDDLRLFRMAVARHVGPAASTRVACRLGPVCVVSIGWMDSAIVDWTFHP